MTRHHSHTHTYTLTEKASGRITNEQLKKYKMPRLRAVTSREFLIENEKRITTIEQERMRE